jgi:hypothetical protein
LSEYALAKIEGIRYYAVDDAIYSILVDLHHEACKRAEPDPEALAKRLCEWELGGDHGTFFDAVNTYADVLGERGLAEKEWADVPTLGPDPENRPRSYGKRERLAEIMQTLAHRSGDMVALVAVKGRDLSNSGAYLKIAHIYKQAGDDEKTLEWAEEGAWVFPGGGHQDLLRFLADEYHDRGRHEEAMDPIWTGFAEELRLDGYEQLKAHADRAGTWERWRTQALDFVREDIHRKKRESKGSYPLFPVDHSRLVEILLWEGNVEEDWREAKELRPALAEPRRPARRGSSRRLPGRLPGEDRTAR